MCDDEVTAGVDGADVRALGRFAWMGRAGELPGMVDVDGESGRARDGRGRRRGWASFWWRYLQEVG